MEKYLFLDIDGVLNSDDFYAETYKASKDPDYCSERLFPKGTAKEAYTGNIDQTAVRLVQKICEQTGCQIVLSSSWRGDSCSTEELGKLGLQIDGKTPMLDDRFRGAEIQKWLESHPFRTYCILDDDTDMLEEQEQHFVHVDFYHGLTNADARKAIEILNR